MRLQHLIDLGHREVLVLLNRVEKELETVESRFKEHLIRVVNHKGNWQVIKDILLDRFTCFVDVLKDQIFVSDAVMVLKVVHKVLLAMFAEEVVLNVRGVRRPLKVKQGDRVGDLLPARPRIEHPLDNRVVVAFHQNVAVTLDVAVFVRLVASHLRVLLLNFLFFIVDLKLCPLVARHLLALVVQMLRKVWVLLRGATLVVDLVPEQVFLFGRIAVRLLVAEPLETS